MKKNTNLFNYTLSIGFILLVMIFLISLVGISRSVLSDSETIRDHVQTTQDLLEDITEVELTVEENEKINGFNLGKNNIINYKQNILDISYININENKSIITLILDSELKEYNNVYYLKYKNLYEINKTDQIIYSLDNQIFFGKVLEIELNILKVLNFETKEIDKITFDKVLGKIIVKK
jgi:hypothetical protein